LVQNGELSPRTFADAHRTCKDLLDYFGKYRRIDDVRQEDFAGYRVDLAKRLGLVTLGNAIQRVRSVFKFAVESGLTTSPILFGPGFKRPSKKTLRIERAKKGPKLFAPDELRRLIEAAGIPLKAMILLACNAGLGNSDLANMAVSAINLKTGWADYPRVKTGVPRRFPLWPETVKALRDALAKRPAARDEADAALLFITKYGGRWCKGTFELSGADGQAEAGDSERERKPSTNNDNEITKEFNKLFPKAGVERWPGRSFYTLRHVFETIGGESRDQVAVDHIMGHARDDMASVYRERIGDERLKAVVMHVHRWLFSKKSLNSKMRAF
jgi:integrase